MQRAKIRRSEASFEGLDRRLAWPGIIIVVQTLAALYFILDAVTDLFAPGEQGLTPETLLECVFALTLVSGVVMTARYISMIAKELRRKDQMIDSARGAMAEHIQFRFAEWGLTPAEAEVALFALKGCDVAEIARVRGAATGTVRSQLSQIYAKSGVTSQAMLVSLFIDDLLEPITTPTG